MELTTTQLYALFAIFAGTALLGFITYRAGLSHGNEIGFERGRHMGAKPWRKIYSSLCEKQAETAALLGSRNRELSGLRLSIEAETDEHAKVERGLLQRLHAAAPMTDEDTATLQAIASKLELAGDTFASLNSPDHARYARNLARHAHNMAARIQASLSNTQQHPDSELIDWLEEEATVDFDLETATLRFLCAPNTQTGPRSVRQILRQAKADSEAIDRNHATSLEAAA